jgi:hypothetical protein
MSFSTALSTPIPYCEVHIYIFFKPPLMLANITLPSRSCLLNLFFFWKGLSQSLTFLQIKIKLLNYNICLNMTSAFAPSLSNFGLDIFNRLDVCLRSNLIK